MQFLIDNLSNIITVVSIAAGVVFGYARLGGKVDNLLNNLEQRRQGVDKRIDKNADDIVEIKAELSKKLNTDDWREYNREVREELKSIREELKAAHEKQGKFDVALARVEVELKNLITSVTELPEKISEAMEKSKK